MPRVLGKNVGPGKTKESLHFSPKCGDSWGTPISLQQSRPSGWHCWEKKNMWQNCSLSGCDKVPLPLAVTALPQMLGPGGSALGEVPGSTLSPLMLLKGTWWPWWPIELLRPSPQETWVRSLGGEDPWRRAWHPTPVFLPGESYGLRSLAGYNPWVRRSWVRLNDCTRMHTHNTSSAILE